MFGKFNSPQTGPEKLHGAMSDEHDHRNPSETRDEALIATPPLTHVMKYVVPYVLALVALKYQTKPDILFGENPVPVWCFGAATSVYWLIVGAMEGKPTLDRLYLQALRKAAIASGLLSGLSLVSMFLQYPVSLLPLLLWVPLPLALLWPVIYQSCVLLVTGIITVINYIIGPPQDPGRPNLVV